MSNNERRLCRRVVSPDVMRWLTALVLGATAVAACGKKEPEKVVTSCVIAFEGDKPSQCFEYSDEAAKKAVRAEQCKQYEGKTRFQEGPCPSEGRGGKCVTKILDTEQVSHCYRDPADCKKACQGAGATFTPN